jgi:2,4-dienoyl-CoA reductase-like NADH-dependent reductase (Old Yellow Enzyme family)
MEHYPVYRNPRTGAMKAAQFANSLDRYWGSVAWDEENRQWVLQRRNSDGTRSAKKSGIAPEMTPARIQRIVEDFTRATRRRN